MNPKKSNEAEGLWTGMCSRAVFSFHHLLMLPLCISHVAMKEFWVRRGEVVL